MASFNFDPIFAVCTEKNTHVTFVIRVYGSKRRMTSIFKDSFGNVTH